MEDMRLHFTATIVDSDAPAFSETVYGHIDEYLETRILPLARPVSTVYFRFIGRDSAAPPISCYVPEYAAGRSWNAWKD